MNINKEKLAQDIDEVCREWDISGCFMAVKDGELLYENYYGFADRENALPTKEDSRYLLHSESGFLVSLCVFMLINQGKVNLHDRLSAFIPEYKHADSMTIENLLRSNSGIPDFFYSRLMVDLNNTESHKALSDFERMRAEQKSFNTNRSFEAVMLLIGDSELEYLPGTTGLNDSESNWAFLAEVVRRASNKSVIEFEKEFVFDPLQMKHVKASSEADTVSYMVYKEEELVRVPLDYSVTGLISVTAKDMEKLLIALGSGKLLSKKLWKEALKYDEEGQGLAFENANGYDCGRIEFIGNGFYFYFNHKTGIAFASLLNENQTFKCIDNEWHYFRRASREVIESTFTYPEAPRMVKLGTDNLWAALSIQVEEEQRGYVLEAKSSIAMGLLYKSKKPFALMEGNRVVGLLVLDIDKKKDHYNIDIIQIDKRFQNRGYGKIMLNWAIDYLKKSGAVELEIGVNRHNFAAQKIYMAAGFKPKSVYENGMSLHMRILPIDETV